MGQARRRQTPLMWAVDGGADIFEVKFQLKLLREKKMSVDKKTYLGETALMFAVQQRSSGVAAIQEERTAIIKLLIDAGADVNAQDKEGMTPLMHAVFLYDNVENAQQLIDAGADIWKRDKRGKIAFYWSCISSVPTETSVILNRAMEKK